MGSTPTRVVAALSVTSFASSASMRVCDALLPRFAADFGIGVDQAAALITVFSIAYGAMLVVYGPLGDRLGKLRVILGAGALSSVWAAACALAPGFDSLLVARALAGGTAAAIIPLGMAWIGDVVPFARRQPVIAGFILGQILGVGAGQLLGGIAADTFGWRTAFTLIAAWYAGASILLFVLQRGFIEPARSAAGGWLTGLATVLSGRWPRIVIVTALVEGAAVYAALAFSALHFHRSAGVSLTQAGAMAMGFGAGGLLYVAFARRIVAALGEKRVAQVGGALMAAGLVAVGMSASARFAVASMLVTGIGYYLFHTALQLQASQMTPAFRGGAVALFAAAFFLGQALGVALAGFAVDRLGTGPVIMGCGVVVAGLALTYTQVGTRHMARAGARGTSA